MRQLQLQRQARLEFQACAALCCARTLSPWPGQFLRQLQPESCKVVVQPSRSRHSPAGGKSFEAALKLHTVRTLSVQPCHSRLDRCSQQHIRTVARLHVLRHPDMQATTGRQSVEIAGTADIRCYSSEPRTTSSPCSRLQAKPCHS